MLLTFSESLCLPLSLSHTHIRLSPFLSCVLTLISRHLHSTLHRVFFFVFFSVSVHPCSQRSQRQAFLRFDASVPSSASPSPTVPRYLSAELGNWSTWKDAERQAISENPHRISAQSLSNRRWGLSATCQNPLRTSLKSLITSSPDDPTLRTRAPTLRPWWNYGQARPERPSEAACTCELHSHRSRKQDARTGPEDPEE